MGEFHATVPTVATGDPGLTAGKIEIADHNAGLWTRVREHTLATVEEGWELVAKLATEIAEGEKQAAGTAGRAAEDRRKGGTAQSRRGRGRWQPYGLSEADILHISSTCRQWGSCPRPAEQHVDESHRMIERHFQRSRRAFARRILRREIAEVDQRHVTPPASETE